MARKKGNNGRFAPSCLLQNPKPQNMILELAASRKTPIICSLSVSYFAHDSDVKDDAFLQYAQPYQAPKPLHCTGDMNGFIFTSLQCALNPCLDHMPFFRHNVPMPLSIKAGILSPVVVRYIESRVLVI
jgi:hypothetical protein